MLDLWPFKSKNVPPPKKRAAKEPVAKSGVSYLDILIGKRQVVTETADSDAVTPLVWTLREYLRTHRPEPLPFPALAARIMELAKDPDADASALSRLVEQDLAVSAKVLGVANSAALRGDRAIATVRDAITRLGMNEVASVAVGFASRSFFDLETRTQTDMLRPRLSRLFQHAMSTAFAAAGASAELGIERSDLVFLGGVFHDLGSALALRSLGALTTTHGAKWPQSEDALDLAIDEVALSHEMGAVIANQELPEFLIDACLHHYRPDTATAPIALIGLASTFDTLARSPRMNVHLLPRCTKLIHTLKLTDAQTRVLARNVVDSQKRVATLFPEV